MKRVYVVTWRVGEYEIPTDGWSVLAVFQTRADAERAIEEDTTMMKYLQSLQHPDTGIPDLFQSEYEIEESEFVARGKERDL